MIPSITYFQREVKENGLLRYPGSSWNARMNLCLGNRRRVIDANHEDEGFAQSGGRWFLDRKTVRSSFQESKKVSPVSIREVDSLVRGSSIFLRRAISRVPEYGAFSQKLDEGKKTALQYD